MGGGAGELCVCSVPGNVLVPREVRLTGFASCLMRETKPVSNSDFVGTQLSNPSVQSRKRRMQIPGGDSDWARSDSREETEGHGE